MALDVDRREVCRYLGLRGAEPDAATAAQIEAAIAALEAAVEPREISRRFAIRRIDGDALEIDGLRIDSRALSKNLSGCEEVFLMAATLGIAPDRLIARAQASGEMGRAMALQAAAAAMIETWCDAVNARLRDEAAREGLSLRPRFSPGYGDFPLACQPGIFQLLGVQKRIGVALTDSLLMIPTKSVTAVIGLSPDARPCPAGCDACGRRECAYRRNEE